MVVPVGSNKHAVSAHEIGCPFSIMIRFLFDFIYQEITKLFNLTFCMNFFLRFILLYGIKKKLKYLFVFQRLVYFFAEPVNMSCFLWWHVYIYLLVLFYSKLVSETKILWLNTSCLSSVSIFLVRSLCQSAVKNLAGSFGLTIVADGHLFGFSATVLNMSRHKDGVHFEPDQHIVQAIQQNWHLI